jgi:hypothetical protein
LTGINDDLVLSDRGPVGDTALKAAGVAAGERGAREAARPTLRVRGLLGRAEPILIVGGRAMTDNTEIFVGIDVAKVRNAIAIADGERAARCAFWGKWTRPRRACGGL